jgi:hypothetical protein
MGPLAVVAAAGRRTVAANLTAAAVEEVVVLPIHTCRYEQQIRHRTTSTTINDGDIDTSYLLCALFLLHCYLLRPDIAIITITVLAVAAAATYILHRVVVGRGRRHPILITIHYHHHSSIKPLPHI